MALNTKQYVVVCAAAAKSKRAAPDLKNRMSLYIQNTGANAGLVRFGSDCRGDGGDILLASGNALKWDIPETTPNESLNFMSVAGTTFCVYEGN